MTWYSSKDVAYLIVDGTDIAGSINTARIKTSAVTVDTTCLGDTWREITDTGLRNGELEISGFYDGSTTSAVIDTVSGTGKVVSVLLEGNTVSKRFYGFDSGTVSAAEVGLSPDTIHTSSPTFTVSGQVRFGYVVAPLAARTTAGNTQSTCADMAALSTIARAYLAVTSLTLGGYDNLIVQVQSCDTSDGSYADETAFAAMTTTGGQVVALSGTVNRYLAVAWQWTGTGTGQSATFFVGVAGT